MNEKNEIKNLMDELIEQIRAAHIQSLKQNIKTNTVILNEDFDLLNEFWYMASKYNPCLVPTMILGKHVFVGKLPKDYSFALTYIDEEKFENDLKYYKNRCEELEEKIKQMKELLGE